MYDEPENVSNTNAGRLNWLREIDALMSTRVTIPKRDAVAKIRSIADILDGMPPEAEWDLDGMPPEAEWDEEGLIAAIDALNTLRLVILGFEAEMIRRATENAIRDIEKS